MVVREVMIDPVISSILLGIAGVSFLIGGYAAYQYQARSERPTAAGRTERSRFRQTVIQAKLPALLVFLPTAISSVLVYLFIGRAGGPPPTRVQLMEIGGVLLVLGTIIGGATLVGSTVGGVLRRASLQE